MDATFTGPRGLDIIAAVHELTVAAQPTAGDAVMAVQFIRTEIRDDTAQGVDSHGNPFAPYSNGYAKEKARNGGNVSVVDLFGVYATGAQKRQRKRGGGFVRASKGIHMLNAMLVSVGGQDFGNSDQGLSPDDIPEAATVFSLGIYDEDAARRAQWHDRGEGRNPVRHFFDANEDRIERMEQIIGQRIEQRLNRRG